MNDQRQQTLEHYEPDDQRARRACVGKVKFPSKRNAAGRARVLAAEYADPSWSFYHCRRCSGWHVGHDRFYTAP